MKQAWQQPDINATAPQWVRDRLPSYSKRTNGTNGRKAYPPEMLAFMRRPEPQTRPKREPLDVFLISRFFLGVRAAFIAIAKGFAKCANGANHCGRFYPRMRGFLAAHLAGHIGHEEYQRRLALCSRCPHIYTHKGNDYCRQDARPGGCNCGHWAAARLRYKAQLSAWRCPLEYFDYGRLGRWMKGRRNGS